MTFWLDLLFLLVVAVGLVGIMLPVLPGTLLIAGAALVWAVLVADTTGWTVLAVVLVLLGLGQLVKYAVPGQRLKRAGIPNSTLLVGALAGLVGFFVVPVIGLPLGFVAGVFAAEVRRHHGAELESAGARANTWSAIWAVVLSVAIELTFGLAAAVTLTVGALTT